MAKMSTETQTYCRNPGQIFGNRSLSSSSSNGAMRWPSRPLQSPVWNSAKTQSLGIQLQKANLSEMNSLWQRELSFFHLSTVCSSARRQSYWLPQPRRRYNIIIVKGISECFTYWSSPRYRFFIIWSVSASVGQWPQTTYISLYRLGRGVEYTFERKYTSCHHLCNCSFHKGGPSSSSCSLLARFTSASCLHRWHCRSFVVGFETGQFYLSKWGSTSTSISFPSSTLDLSFFSVRYLHILL